MTELRTVDMDHTGMPVISTPAAAEMLCGRLYKTLESLRQILQAETQHLKKMELSDVDKIHGKKSGLSRDYLNDLKIFKANVDTIREHSPSSLEALQRKHEALRAAIAENETVLGTIRDVSETLIRRTAERVGEASRPKTYARTAQAGSGVSKSVAAVAYDSQL
jgi:hypothetical protein